LQGHENCDESFGAHVGITTSKVATEWQGITCREKETHTDLAPAQSQKFSPLALEGEGVGGVGVSYRTPMKADT
jgi:hypothetical protein